MRAADVMNHGGTKREAAEAAGVTTRTLRRWRAESGLWRAAQDAAEIARLEAERRRKGYAVPDPDELAAEVAEMLADAPPDTGADTGHDEAADSEPERMDTVTPGDDRARTFQWAANNGDGTGAGSPGALDTGGRQVVRSRSLVVRRASGPTPTDLRRRLRGSIEDRVQTLEAIADHPDSTDTVRIRAIETLLRYGLGQVARDTVSRDELRTAVESMWRAVLRYASPEVADQIMTAWQQIDL